MRLLKANEMQNGVDALQLDSIANAPCNYCVDYKFTRRNKKGIVISRVTICTGKLDIWKINCAQCGIICPWMDAFIESLSAENCILIIELYPSNPFAFDFRPN